MDRNKGPIHALLWFKTQESSELSTLGTLCGSKLGGSGRHRATDKMDLEEIPLVNIEKQHRPRVPTPPRWCDSWGLYMPIKLYEAFGIQHVAPRSPLMSDLCFAKCKYSSNYNRDQFILSFTKVKTDQTYTFSTSTSRLYCSKSHHAFSFSSHCILQNRMIHLDPNNFNASNLRCTNDKRCDKGRSYYFLPVIMTDCCWHPVSRVQDWIYDILILLGSLLFFSPTIHQSL